MIKWRAGAVRRSCTNPSTHEHTSHNWARRPHKQRWHCSQQWSMTARRWRHPVTQQPKRRKRGALRPQKPLRLIRNGGFGGQEFYIYHLIATLSLPEWLCIKAGSCVTHFHVSLIVWAKSQDSVHKPPFLKRRERTAETNRTEVLLLTNLAPCR